jgi:plastocyanin
VGKVKPQPSALAALAMPVAVGGATIEVALPDLTARGLIISVERSETDSTVIACAAIAGAAADGDLVLGLDGGNDSSVAGVAVLRPAGEQTNATLYLLTLDRQPVAPAVATAARVEIVDVGDDWTFQPASLTVAPGTTVTWTNDTEMSHTITGDDLAFDDSGPIGSGQSFSQTFAKPGTYRYHCGPHPWMEGTLVVQ